MSAQKLAAKYQRPHRLPPLEVYLDHKLYCLSSEPYLRVGPTFATLYLSRFGRDDVLLTREQGLALDRHGSTEASINGRRARVVAA